MSSTSMTMKNKKPKKAYTAAQKAAYAENQKAKRGAKSSGSTYKKKSYPSKNYGMTPYNSKKIIFPMELFNAIKYKDNVFPLPNSLGNVICHNYVQRTPVVPSAVVLQPTIVILQFTSSDVIGLTYLHGNGAVSASTVITNPQFYTDAPSHKRNSRFTLNIMNTSSNNNMGGTITVAQTQAPLEWEFGASTTTLDVGVTFQNEIMTILNSSSRSKQYTGAQCQMGLIFSLVPISMQALATYDTPTPLGPVTNPSLPFKTAFLESNDLGSHGCFIIRFDAIASQTYTIETHVQYAARHPPNTLLGSLGKRQPIASALTLQNVINDASEVPAGQHDPAAPPSQALPRRRGQPTVG